MIGGMQGHQNGDAAWHREQKGAETFESVLLQVRKALCGNIHNQDDIVEMATRIVKQRDELLADLKTQAAKDVIAERQRQREVEGWTPEHDDRYKMGELSHAAGSYAMNAGTALFFSGGGDTSVCYTPPCGWPWTNEWWKPTSARRDLVKAAALILAEIERIDRAAIVSVQGGV